MLAQGRPSGAALQALTRSEVWFLRRPRPEALSAERPVRHPATPIWQQLLGVLLLACLRPSRWVGRRSKGHPPWHSWALGSGAAN